jgi:hypothetical protein
MKTCQVSSSLGQDLNLEECNYVITPACYIIICSWICSVSLFYVLVFSNLFPILHSRMYEIYLLTGCGPNIDHSKFW